MTTNSQILDYATLASLAYDAPSISAAILPSNYQLILQTGEFLSGYNGFSVYDSGTNTLVISSAGTNFLNPMDLLQDYGLAISGATAQYLSADLLARQSWDQINADLGSGPINRLAPPLAA